MTLWAQGLTYASVESLAVATDTKYTARMDSQLKNALEAGANTLEAQLHRRFAPWSGTRYFDYPTRDFSPSWKLPLGMNELISASTVVAAGTTIASTDYFLRRYDDLDEPPYGRIEIDLASSAAFAAGSTTQRQVAITGIWGFQLNDVAAGTITANVSSTTATTIAVSNSAAVGVGNALLIDSERLIVTAKAMVDTAQNTSVLSASEADVSITSITAGSINVGETLLIDSERMLVVDVAGTTLTVKRKWDGSALTAHLVNADIYAPRTVTVTRGALGTTAATHTSATAVYRHDAPALIQELNIAEALTTMGQRLAGYAREVGSGENTRESSGRGLKQIREDAYTTFGRKARKAAV
jgi:hypothetical protein